MNTLRKSFVNAIIQDDNLVALNASFSEVKLIIYNMYIAGEDYELNAREKDILDGNLFQSSSSIKN